MKALLLISSLALVPSCQCLSLPPSRFCGRRVVHKDPSHHEVSLLTMRKQKASDKRTRRSQRGQVLESDLSSRSNLRSSPIGKAWQYKSVDMMRSSSSSPPANAVGYGRGRSRKRSQVYNNLSSYHSHFLDLITQEFLAEESLVRDRIEGAAEDPLYLEATGHALFDMYPERRGNIFSEEVYRLVKAHDATIDYSEVNQPGGGASEKGMRQSLPSTNKFSQNDVIMLSLQPGGSGDFFGKASMPTRKESVSLEARVLGTGPSYIDLAVPGGSFESTFGPAPNNVGSSGRGDKSMRLRADRYFSNVPFDRMVTALSQMTAVPERNKVEKTVNSMEGETTSPNKSRVDESIRQMILSAYVLNDTANPLYNDLEGCKILDLAKRVAKPPLPESIRFANEVLGYLQTNPQQIFPQFNAPQLSAIGAALTRRLTMIQGPPGTGKTTVAASIAFGFVHQCRHTSKNNKVLATAFSNVGADNLAENLIRVGLKVVRVGKASAVSSHLWDYTLDAAIAKDPEAQKALIEASKATANLREIQVDRKGSKGSSSRKKVDISSARNRRELATSAVKASIEACNCAATKAMREADVIVCTSIGAADPRLLAACGIVTSDDEYMKERGLTTKKRRGIDNSEQQLMAPDGLPPLATPFVLIDEACQSVEPASLVPLFATNSCQSLVMLGDPCQLPPTILSDTSSDASSSLSVSLMSRLAATLPQPVIVTAKNDKSPKDEQYLNLKLTKQAVSLVKLRGDEEGRISYRKKFSGSLLLTVQYRMHPSIAAFSSAVFYDSLLSTPESLKSFRTFPNALDEKLSLIDQSHNVRFINVGGRNNERKDKKHSTISPLRSGKVSTESNTSFSNPEEAHQILYLIKSMMKNQMVEPLSVGIVTPYSAQVILIKSLMASDQDFRSLLKDSNVSIEVNSVDAYQGRERDLIFFSSVRSNRSGNIGFLRDWRRMNVALTRAKRGLVVVGDIDTLKEGDRHWEAFCNWCEGMECVFDIGDEDTNDS